MQVRSDDSSRFGMICKLGENSSEIVYSKDRLLYPQKRVGKKGSFNFERISWEEAFEIISIKLKNIKINYGAEATSIYTGRGSFELALCDVFQPKGVAVSSASSLLFPFGSPNTMGVGALCYVSFAMIAPHVTMGGMLINMFSDIEQSDLIVIWGANPATDCPPLDLDRITKAYEAGAKLVVIDPRKTSLAKLEGARWIPIRPGTDGALALGLCNILIVEELYDDKFVRDWTLGFEEFASYVQHFSPELVESITQVPKETIIELAREIVQANGASPIMYSGLEYCDSGVQAIRATQVLWALAGQMDVPGGRCFSMRENQFLINRDGLIANPNLKKSLGRDQFPVYSQYRGESHAISLPQSVLNEIPYKIRSLIILGGSIITAWPEPEIWRKTLNKLDFLVCIDRNQTADMAFADLILPATTLYEIDSYMIYGPLFRKREKVIEPLGEARNDFFILAEIAKRLGYGELYPQTDDELIDYVLKGTGYTRDDLNNGGGTLKKQTVMMQYKKWEKGHLRKDNKPGFETPTGKFEIHSTILEEHGYDPLPKYTEPKYGPLGDPELAKNYPLVLNTGSRVTTDFRSQHHSIKSLYEERPEPTVTLNAEDAVKRKIEQGSLVELKTPKGKAVLRVIVTNDIIKGTVDANMGGGGPLGPKAWQNCNINDLTDLYHFDAISGFPVYKALLCDVAPLGKNKSNFSNHSGEYIVNAKVTNKIKKKRSRIYLDHNATTPISHKIRQKLSATINEFGNPSGIYKEAKESKAAIEKTRRIIAEFINCTARRLVFTSGGSESNNLAIKGSLLRFNSKKNQIISTPTEHPSISNQLNWLKIQGYEIVFLDVDPYGRVSSDDLKKKITDKTALISVMTANNETGTIQPIKELVEIAKKFNPEILFHTDAVQAFGKIHLDVQELGIDLLTMSGHKFYAPKGIGALYIKNGVELDPIIHGGGQENQLRGGTENLHGIISLGIASEDALNQLEKSDQIKKLRDRLEEGILKIFPQARINGHKKYRLPNTLSMIIPGFRGESLVLALDQKGISISSGSACRSGSPKPSYALLAMGLSEEEAHCTVRFSLGISNTKRDIDLVLKAIKSSLNESENLLRFVPCR
ncbi:MAG: IscS subfamily cysteine desulfurase [Deltaproteobacteria bacterium]|nr:IscS subfamily cysteine desulfurase [Deltaproteobacteria bacterium]